MHSAIAAGRVYDTRLFKPLERLAGFYGLIGQLEIVASDRQWALISAYNNVQFIRHTNLSSLAVPVSLHPASMTSGCSQTEAVDLIT